jgi:hypothetical protein
MNENLDRWVEVARALPADAADKAYWRPSRQLAERDAREWSSYGDVMHIQLGRVRQSDLSTNCHSYLTTDEALIDWGALEVVPGLVDEEIRAIEVLRDADIDFSLLATIQDAFRARAARAAF